MRIRYDNDAVDEQQLAKTTGFKGEKLRQSFELEERSDLPAELLEGAIHWLKSKPRGHKDAPPFTVRTTIAALRWDYQPQERQRIADAIRNLVAEDAIEPALQQLRTYGRNYLLTLVTGRAERQKHWARSGASGGAKPLSEAEIAQEAQLAARVAAFDEGPEAKVGRVVDAFGHDGPRHRQWS